MLDGVTYAGLPYSSGQGRTDITNLMFTSGLVEEPLMVLVDNVLIVDGYYVPSPSYPSATMAFAGAMAASAMCDLGNMTASASMHVNAKQGA